MVKQYRILACDDEPAYLDLYHEVLGAVGYQVLRARDGEQCLKIAPVEKPDLILLDIKLPGKSGIEVCNELKAGRETQYIPIIFVSATFEDVSDRVNSIEAGADDYLTKPFITDELIARVKAILRLKELQEKLVREERSKVFLREEIKSLEAQLAGALPTGSIIGRNPRMDKIGQLIASIKDTVANVLILGETGTGKSMIAEAVHRSSARKDGPFLKVDCSALAGSLLESELFGHESGAFTGAVKRRQGRFERAHGGTIFLDEIGELPMDLQSKLLRVVQDMQFERVGGDETLTVDVRIIAATNVDLERAVDQRAFRKDLFYRLNVIRIDLPPLRDRPEDIPLLIEHFLVKYGVKNRKEVNELDGDAMRRLLEYPWPGNVRELENVIERAVVLCPGKTVPADLVMLPERRGSLPLMATDRPLKDVIDEAEKAIIEATLRRHDGSVQASAKALGLNRTTLYSKLKKYGIAAS
jgi:two-component system response regulator AtoC